LTGGIETTDIVGLGDHAEDWNRLAEGAGTPFLSYEWLRAWCTAFEEQRAPCLLVRDADGSLAAGACFRHMRRGQLLAAASVHSEDWAVVATGDSPAETLWRGIAAMPWRRAVFPALREDAGRPGLAEAVLRNAGSRVVREVAAESPYLRLSGTFDELLGTRSRNFRSQLNRRRRALESAGSVAFRTSSRPADVERDIDAFLAVEAGGWKSRSRTAILSNPRTEALYRGFARAAAERGWLRLHLLELDGEVVAGDYACVYGGGEYLLKTGYDERFGRFSPGLVLRADVLRQATEAGLRFYDFLGGPDHYKLRWTQDMRTRFTLRAYRGRAAGPAYLYRSVLRPRLKAVRDRLRPPPS